MCLRDHHCERLRQAQHEALFVRWHVYRLPDERGDHRLAARGAVSGVKNDMLARASNDVVRHRELFLDQDAPPAVEAEGARRVRVDQDVAIVVGKKQLEVRWQIGGQQREHAVQVDVDHHHAQWCAQCVGDGCGQLQGRLVQPGVGAALVIDRDLGQVELSRLQLQGLGDVRVVAFLLQIIPRYLDRQITLPVDAHPLQAVLTGRNEPNLEVRRVGQHHPFKQGGQLPGLRAVGVLQYRQCAGQTREHFEVAGDFLA